MHLSDRIALQIGSSNRIIKDIPKGVQTALLDNAGVISKQASKYSTVRKAIVLCDYRKSRTIMFWNMIVLDFPALARGKKDYDDETSKTTLSSTFSLPSLANGNLAAS